jgi:hypothetical protein
MLKEGQAPTITPELPGLGNTAELNQGDSSRLSRRHAAAQIFVYLQLEMGFEFIGQFLLPFCLLEKTKKPEQRRAQPSRK